MIDFPKYITENAIYDELYDYIIQEQNELIFPTNGKYSPIRIKYGVHTKQRQGERHIKKREIIDTIFKAKSQITSMIKDGTLKVSQRGEEPYNFIIIDSTTNRINPLSVVGFVGSTRKNGKEMTIVVKTVARYSDFAGAKRKDSEREKHIYLY